MEEKYIVALEIGSSKIKGAVGTVDSHGALSVKAVEEERITDTVRYGCVRNVVETAAAVRNVISRLERREAPRKVEGVYLSIGGRSLTSQIVEIERRFPGETEITSRIIEDITDEALAYSLHDRNVVSVTPRELRVDGAAATRAIGMFGSQVTARLNLISCRTQLLRNLMLVIEDRLHLTVFDTFVRPLAEADLVLLSEEKRLGCMLVDFGAETTTVAIYKNGVLVHLATLPMGSRNITRDITALNHLEERAEELKILGGSALGAGEGQQPHIASQIDFQAINNYVSARAGEIILNIIEQIKYAGLSSDKLAAGIVVVGKGARLNGFNQRLEQMSGLRVRTGAPGNRIRILDGRIQSSDSVDVIAILAEAARNGARDCMSSPAPVMDKVPIVNEPDYIAPGSYRPQVSQASNPEIPAHQPERPARQPERPAPQVISQRPQPVRNGEASTVSGSVVSEPRKKNRLASALGSLRDRVAKLMTENLYEEDDEE